MAEEQIGVRRDDTNDPWAGARFTMLFKAFKVALDPKKLILAAAGILVMAFGWWLLSFLFYSLNPNPPKLDDYLEAARGQAEGKDESVWKNEAWKSFKRDLNRWSLLHRLAGAQPGPDTDDKSKYRYSVVDFANSYTEYQRIETKVEEIKERTSKRRKTITVTYPNPNEFAFVYDEGQSILVSSKAKKEDVEKYISGRIKTKRLRENYDEATKKITLEGMPFTVVQDAHWKNFIDWYKDSDSFEEIESDINKLAQQRQLEEARILRKALELVRRQDDRTYKPAGYLRTWPWFEQRGHNPFLIVTSLSATSASERPWGNRNILVWLVGDQVPVMIEPLVKLLTPVVYLFHPSANSILNRTYLLCVLFWTLLTWAFFGGAITRMAVVQVARHNEKVGLRDALTFACKRYKSYFLCQFLPIIFLGILTLLLGVFGFFENLLVGVGDIVLTAIFMPLGLLFGLIMAVVLIGLIGWPMMYTTISAEGTDSFDAISRSYSYVFQAPWYYLGYCLLAVLYGAALVFFVSLMGSLTVYLTKFGMSLFPVVPNRDPSMLFMWAPTSYGWRDLLLYQAPHAVLQPVVMPSGEIARSYRLEQAYLDTLGIHNYIGAFFVAFWTYLLFLVVIGFGYSYFWTATSIIYLLMRREVDDTEMDEIHFEEEDLDAPYSATPGATPGADGTTGLPMVPSQTAVQPAGTSTAPATSSAVAAGETSSTPTPPPETPAKPPAETSSDTGSSDTGSSDTESKKDEGTGDAESSDKSESNGERDGEKSEEEAEEKKKEGS